MAGSIWKQREPELRAMAGTMTADKIAQHYGITRGGLSYQASRLGISLAAPADIRRRDCGGGPPRVWKQRREELPALAERLTDTEIAAHYECDLYVLRARCRRWGITLRRGEAIRPQAVPWRIPEQI
jgi:hypothetical protein